jgi:nucleoside diphosphate kinase
METTLALIKPDAIQHAEAIMDAATENGFVILRVSLVKGRERGLGF